MRFSALVRVRNSLGAAVLAVLIFLPAGRLDYWQGWLFLVLSLGFTGLSGWLLKDRTGLIDERFHPGKGMKWWDKGYVLLSTPLYFAAIGMAAYDAGRDAWVPHPEPAVYFPALAVFLAGQGLYLWAKGVNPFFSSVARIQTDRGQVVCRDGPYRFCRHPGYLGGLLFGLTTPLVLGSYWALIPQVLAGLLLLTRTVLEDRMLTRDLLWYAEYKQAVSSLLLPGLF
jgi:protein-S-isoprenylcysteine O-methyltransferase Ste14